MYAKVFAQIYDGSLCAQGDWRALVTFQQLLILADQEGVVDMSPSTISRRTTIPLEIIEPGIAALLLPDPESRTPDEDGRRIVPLAPGRTWGWRIVNYKHYRGLKREQDRRDYHREYYHSTRKLKAVETVETQHDQPATPIAKAEAEAKAEAKASQENVTVTGPAPSAPAPAAAAFASEASGSRTQQEPAFDGSNRDAVECGAAVLLAKTFELPEEWGQAAVDDGWPPEAALYQSAKFRHYWTVGRGAGGAHSVGTWRHKWMQWLERAATEGVSA